MNKIAIYAEQFDGKVEAYTAELISAAKKMDPGAECLIFCLGPKVIAQHLNWPGVSVVMIPCGTYSSLQDDYIATVIECTIRKINPDCILVPATRTARSIFSRVAVKLNVGMTADCTELVLTDDGAFLQRKPAFGANAMVSCIETDKPAIITVQIGVYCPCEHGEGDPIIELSEQSGLSSGIKVLEMVESDVESIAGAEKIVVVGRGAMDAGNFEMAQEFAKRIGAVIGGTRPLVDSGTIPFEQQIGQTGCTVHPKICLSLGVSGAIQHTEGIRDTKLIIAVNNDPNAAIFGFADYGVVSDMKDVLSELLLG